MTKKTLTAELSQQSLENLAKDLEQLGNNVTKEFRNKVKEYGIYSKKYLENEFAENNLGNHISSIKLSPVSGNYSNGFKISSDDEVVVYNEFGTGIVGEQQPSRLASESGYQYNVPSPYKGEDGSWWYWKNGSWHNTRGMVGKNMFADLADELRDNVGDELNVSVGHAINNYNSRR